MMRKIIFLLCTLLLLPGCSGEPPRDELTGVWSDGEHQRLEFLAPNAVVWQRMQPGSHRSWKNEEGRQVKEVATTEAVRFGLYEKEDGKLTIYWVSLRNSSGYMPETVFDLEALEENRLELRTADSRWNSYHHRGKAQPLHLVMKRDNGLTKSSAELKGVWRGPRSVQAFDSLGHQVSFVEHRVDRYRQATVDESTLTLTQLNPFPNSNQTVWHWKKDGQELSLLTQQQKEQGQSFEKATVFQRQKEPLRLTSGGALKFEAGDKKRAQ